MNSPNKITALIAAIVLLVLVLAAPALADDSDQTPPPGDVGSAASLANPEVSGYTQGYNPQWFRSTNVNGHGWNNDTYRKHLVIAYGDPSAPDNTGYPRYVGESTQGESITNIDHPFDVNIQWLDQQDWVKRPWTYANSSLIAADTGGQAYGVIAPNAIDGSAQLTDAEGVTHDLSYEIYKGLCITDPSHMQQSDVSIDWALYVHIWDPPTTSTWGCGIMYNTGSGNTPLAQATNVLYKTVLLPPWHMSGLVVSPSSATVQAGGTQQYTAKFYWNSSDESGPGQDVTTQSGWTAADTSIASIGNNTGLATGVAAGTTGITANYWPPYGDPVNGTASITVQQKQPVQSPENGGENGGNSGGGGNGGNGGNGELSLVAVNAPTWDTSHTWVTQQGAPAPKVTRISNTAEWSDMIAATLTHDAPDGASYVPAGGYYDGETWSVQSASITYPGINPLWTAPNPIDPTPGETTSTAMTANGQTAAAQFEETWSLDGMQHGLGIYSIVQGKAIDKNPGTYQVTAQYILSCTVTYYTISTDANGNTIKVYHTITVNPTGTASQALTVDGAGTLPSSTGTGQGAVSEGIRVSTDN
ncbi:MAG: Ig-like domain-containing protein [Dehalococcoidia bacterium]|jgi:hypothetical protein